MFAHHPEKKIIKKIVDRRPKKHRLSDINRKNINADLCITKIPNAPADYTIITAAGKYMFILTNNNKILILCIHIYISLSHHHTTMIYLSIYISELYL